jgi:hypothetical protein
MLAKEGVDSDALKSIHSLFQTTRDIIKHRGRDCIEFTKIAIIILNQKVRPFTTKWHGIVVDDVNLIGSEKEQFRKELEELKNTLITYSKMLSDMAGVEDLTELV